MFRSLISFLLPKKKPKPYRVTWGPNPNCPKCGNRTGVFDILKHQVFCYQCRDVVYQLHHWPVPADYLKRNGTRLTHVVPPLYKPRKLGE